MQRSTPNASMHGSMYWRHAAAHLHHARTVVRRAERFMTEIAYQEPVNPSALKYANRLSDLLFTLARVANHRAGAGEVTW